MPYRRVYLVVLCSVVIACGLPAHLAFGQEGAQSLTQPDYRWLVRVSLGTTSSGPANDLEKAMVASGFNKTSPGLGSGGVAHPFSRTGIGEIGYPWMIAVQYAVNPTLLLGVTASRAPIGTTLGCHDPNLFLNLEYSVSTYSPTVSVRLSDAVHLGVGPALYVTEGWQERAGGGRFASQSATKVGALMDLGVSTPTHSRFFAVFSLQYRYVGTMTLGPFEASLGQHSATLPAATVSYSHFFFSVGVGVRL